MWSSLPSPSSCTRGAIFVAVVEACHLACYTDSASDTEDDGALLFVLTFVSPVRSS